MRVIDLTQTIAENMPVYPGTEPPGLAPANTYERDGFRETLLTLYSHTGTHVDAPGHLYHDRLTLDHFPAEQFGGSALMLDCRHKGPGEEIGMEELKKHWDKVDAADFLIFQTGWSRYWGSEAYFGNYPVVSYEIIDYLVSAKKKGIGLDCIGLDAIAAEDLPRHHRLLGAADCLIYENLTQLELLGSELFTFMGLPLKFEDADGAPVRAIAVLGDDEADRKLRQNK